MLNLFTAALVVLGGTLFATSALSQSSRIRPSNTRPSITQQDDQDPGLSRDGRRPNDACGQLSPSIRRATKVDFRGTPLLPASSGEAKVESKQGYIEIEVEFDDLQPANRAPNI